MLSDQVLLAYMMAILLQYANNLSQSDFQGLFWKMRKPHTALQCKSNFSENLKKIKYSNLLLLREKTKENKNNQTFQEVPEKLFNCGSRLESKAVTELIAKGLMPLPVWCGSDCRCYS